MLQNKILYNQFTWTPLHLVPDTPPRKPDHRMPLLWLSSYNNHSPHGHDLFLINHTGETLGFVGASVGGFITADDEVLPVSGTSIYKYHYTKVPHNAAVKIEEYDGFYDLDYVLSVTLEIKSPTLGHVEIRPPAAKGGVKQCILLWNTGELGKYVNMHKISQIN